MVFAAGGGLHVACKSRFGARQRLNVVWKNHDTLTLSIISIASVRKSHTVVDTVSPPASLPPL
eukprot:1190194-Prorocentrum_minimum.AAC.1